MPNWREEIITAEEMANTLGISESAVQDQCRAGRMPAVKRFRRWFILKNLWVKQMEREAIDRLAGIQDPREASR